MWAGPIRAPHAGRADSRSACAATGQAAAEQHIFVVAGLTERDGDRIYNSAVLLDDRGHLLLCHRKINELDIAQDLYAIGDRLQVAHTTLGVLGVNICADNFPNALDIGRTLGRMGAQILLSPSAWAVDADHDPTREPYGALWRDAYRNWHVPSRCPSWAPAMWVPSGEGRGPVAGASAARW